MVSSFRDDRVVTEGFLGGAGRFHVRPRVSIGPEIAFVSGEHHSHFMLTGNVTFDFLGPVNGQPRTVTPFAVIGGGIFQTREEFPTGSFTSADPAFTAGAGVRVRLGRSGFAGVETRIGWELHIRLNGLVGVRLLSRLRPRKRTSAGQGWRTDTDQRRAAASEPANRARLGLKPCLCSRMTE